LIYQQLKFLAMKKIISLFICFLFVTSGFAKEKVFLTDLIEKHEKIPVAAYAWNVIKRTPDAFNTQPNENKKDFDRKFEYQVLDSVIKSLNEAFDTDKFYLLPNAPDYKADFKEAGHTFWVIVDMQGFYEMGSTSFKFKLQIAQYFHYIDEKGKIKRTPFSSKIVNEYCDAVNADEYTKLGKMMSLQPVDCHLGEAIVQLRKDNEKFAIKEKEKAAKAKAK
jgi:hypothetical protein